MSKYIIEIAEEYEEYFKGVLICGIADGKFAVDVIAREDLEELNSDYINENFGSLQDEAYQRGHDDGYEAGCATAFKPVSDAEYQRGYDEGYKKCLSVYDFDQPCISCEGYKRGLNDAWEAAQRICAGEFCGKIDTGSILNMTAQEAIDKIKAYEDNDRIEVGDEVKAPFGTAVVVCCDYDADKASYIYSSGRHGFDNTWNLKKTGKHYDIQSILEAMRNDR